MALSKQRELLEYPNVKTRTISSQASWKQVEGSETNAWNLSSLCGHGGKATRARCGLFKKEPKI